MLCNNNAIAYNHHTHNIPYFYIYNAYRYNGGFKAGVMHGEGHMTYGDGATFEGQWANDKHEGKGKS